MGLWDGKDDAGAWVPDGTYRVFLEAVVIRTEIDDEDDSDGDGTLDRDEHSGTSHAPELPEDHLVDGLVSPFVPVLVDNTPPRIAVEPLPTCTMEPALAFAGSSETGAVVTVTLAGVDTEAITGESGTWSLILTLPPNSESGFLVVARDALYNVATGPSGRVIHDDIAPIVGITAPADNVVVLEPTVNVVGFAADTNMRHVSINNAFVFPWKWAAFDVALEVPLVGSLLIAVTAGDCAGNATTELRHVTRSPMCTSSRECEDLVLADPDIACQQVGECNSDGRCEFRNIVAPSSFCQEQVLWLWTCSLVSTPVGPQRQWTCSGPADSSDDARNCGRQV